VWELGRLSGAPSFTMARFIWAPVSWRIGPAGRDNFFDLSPDSQASLTFHELQHNNGLVPEPSGAAGEQQATDKQQEIAEKCHTQGPAGTTASTQ